MNETFTIRGSVTAILYDQFGQEKDRREIHNLIVTTGRGFIASRIVGSSDAVMGYIAVGTGTTEPAAGQTALVSEASGGRVAVDTALADGPTVQFSATFGPNVPTAEAAITEAGIFNDSSAGTMMCRAKFNAVNKATTDTLTINWNVTINAA